MHQSRPSHIKLYRGLATATLALLGIAMLFYPGSDPFNAATTQYSLLRNTLSDLGMIKSYAGETLTASRWLFALALACAAGATAIFFSVITRNNAARRCGAVAAVCLAAIPFVPSDTILPLHNSFFFGVVVFSSAGLWLAYAKEKRPVFAYLAALLSAYVIFLLIAPAPTTSIAIRGAHAALQKLVMLAVFATLALYKLPAKKA